MSSKPKALLKHSKSRPKKEQVLVTADDYQAAGVDFEDAAGKWRAGDAVKSMRFFQRALDVYKQGLQLFPTSFDLAYNEARVQLEMATHPILVKQLHQPILVVLKAALESHRYALAIDQDNADILFNTAQVLTTIAEEIAKNDSFDDAEAIQCLEEALEMQSRCLSLQELKYEESLSQQHASQNTHDDHNDSEEDEDNGGAPVSSPKEQEDQWFSVVEPVTKDVLIDTILTQLGSLTTLCGILSGTTTAVPQSILAWVEEYSTNLLERKLPSYVQDYSERLPEIALARATFVSALLEAGFRSGTLDAITYKRERDAVFATDELKLQTSATALIANAISLMSFSSALGDSEPSDSANMRWNALSAAIVNLATASKILGATGEETSRTHLLRGDCSMLQYQMGISPTSYHSAVTNAPQLLKNAEVFYRNASKLSLDQDERDTASFRSAIAQYLQRGDRSIVASAGNAHGESWTAAQLEEMVSEGLLSSITQIT